MKNNAYIMTVLESICPHNHSRSGLAVTHLLGEGLVTDDMKNQDQSSKVVLLQSQTQFSVSDSGFITLHVQRMGRSHLGLMYLARLQQAPHTTHAQ